MSIVILIAVILAISCWFLHRRLAALHDRLESAERIAGLRWESTRDRLAAIEGGLLGAPATQAAAAAPAVTTQEDPVPVEAATDVVRGVAPAGAARDLASDVVPGMARDVTAEAAAVAPAARIPSPPPPPAPAPAFSRFRERLAGKEWETVLGGSWLNKLGVLVLVIGIALFMGYSMKQLGPSGRVLLAAVSGVIMLAGGVFVERRPQYKIFGRGLISGGWATLYFTAYASHALDAARVIEDPILGTALICAVSIGMIVHTLRYRSQAVTILAYVAAFAALSFTPLSYFAVLALIPLTASLLFVSDRFGWQIAAVLALPGVYGLYFFHALQMEEGNLLGGQALLVCYWLLFELFDLRMAAKRVEGAVIAALFPLNAFAFVNLAWLQWAELAPDSIWGSFALGAGLLLATAVARMRLQGKESHSYIGPLVISSFLAAIAIFLRFDGMSVNLALLVQGEMLFLAGLFLRLNVLRWLGAGVFAVAGAKMVGWDIGRSEQITLAGAQLHDWSPLAMLKVGVFYLNRRLLPKAGLYGHAAAAALALTLMFELPLEWVGPGLLIAAIALLAFGERAAQADFKLQSVWVAALSFGALLGVNVAGIGITTTSLPWQPQAAGALLCLALTVHLHRQSQVLADTASAAGTIVAAALLWNVVPEPWFALAWAGLAAAIVWTGHEAKWPVLRAQGHVLALLSTLAVLGGQNLSRLEAAGVILPMIGLHYLIGTRVRERFVDRAYLYSAALLAMAFVAVQAPDEWIAPGWAALAALFLAVGVRLDKADLRWQGLALGGIATAVCALNTLPDHGVLPGALVVAGLFAGQLLAPPRFRPAFALFATTTLTLLLYHQVSGRLLTVAWGVAGLSLLVAGFPLRERILRLVGLALLLVCIVKLFAYDLQHLAMPDRILSFLILGVILIGVSWFYTRFRERILGFFERGTASAAPPE